jgi:hypothetical protein
MADPGQNPANGHAPTRVLNNDAAYLSRSFTNTSGAPLWVKFALRFGEAAGEVAVQVEEVVKMDVGVVDGKRRSVFTPGRQLWLLDAAPASGRSRRRRCCLWRCRGSGRRRWRCRRSGGCRSRR